MSERAKALAERYEQANGELIAMVEQSSDEGWRRQCRGETWPVAVTAHHVGASTGFVANFVQLMADGRELPPITTEMLDRGNAQHAEQYANCSKEETAELLRRDGQQAASTVRGLSDEQLDRTSPMSFMDGAPWSTQQFIENVLIGHVQTHSQSIKEAVGS